MTAATSASRGHASPAPLLVVWLLILLYTGFFSVYTLQRHATLNTFAADLSFIDQPMWNTLHGRFLERTLDATQAPRVAEHFEPLLLPLSLVFLAWDDVRALLILQTIALAIGALPVFWIARHALREHAGETRAGWLGVVFAAAYLSFPALQAANVADFHADPFVVAPLTFAFWYALRGRWAAMWAWALVVMAAKENMATLTAMLGLLLLAEAARQRRRERRGAGDAGAPDYPPGKATLHGAALVGVSLAWFVVATFVIVAPLAREVYGAGGPIYLANRYVEFGATPGDWLRAAWAALREPARVAYLVGLLSSTGWLALLAPEYLLLGLPILVANLFSNFPGQFSGEQHYSAPLVSALTMAAIFGAARLLRLVRSLRAGPAAARGRGAPVLAVVLGAWVLTWALAQQIDRGWTPASRYFTWPARTAHAALLGRFLAQIPADAAVSASPAVHAHLAHRHKIYVYPVVQDASFILVDVTGVTDMHPLDLKRGLEAAVSEGGFGIVDAADGYVLLQRGAGTPSWPAGFTSFLRADGAQPAHAVSVRFGDYLELAGYDVIDEPRLRLTRFRFYFRVLSIPPPGASVRYEARSPGGKVVDSDEMRPMPALLWRPPEQWQAGETVVVETTSWFLPRAFAPVVSVTSNGARVPAQLASGSGATVIAGAVLLPGWTRTRGLLQPLAEPAGMTLAEPVAFSAPGWTVELAEWSAPSRVAPGQELPVDLRWASDGPGPRDFSVFLHVRDASGRTVAQADGQPAWFLPDPASGWVEGAGQGRRDVREVAVPPDLAPGAYRLVVGWYDWETGGRLAVLGPDGNPAGDEAVLGDITVDASAGPAEDAVCLMAAESCASLE